MKYLFFLLMLIGSAKGQDTSIFNGTANSGLSVSAVPRETFSAELVVYDSTRLIGYQKKDSTLVIIGDSARFIKIILESMLWTREFKVRYAKRKYKQNLILIPGKGTIIIRYQDTIFSRIDTVKWTPYYQKKKYHPHNTVPMPNGTSFFPYPDGDTAWFMDYQKRHPKEFTDSALKIYYGGVLQSNDPVFHPLGKGLKFTGATLTTDSVDTIYSSNGFITGFKRDLWLPELYPWWKKALWMVAGALVLCLIVFFYVLATEPKNIDL